MWESSFALKLLTIGLVVFEYDKIVEIFHRSDSDKLKLLTLPLSHFERTLTSIFLSLGMSIRFQITAIFEKKNTIWSLSKKEYILIFLFPIAMVSGWLLILPSTCPVGWCSLGSLTVLLTPLSTHTREEISDRGARGSVYAVRAIQLSASLSSRPRADFNVNTFFY